MPDDPESVLGRLQTLPDPRRRQGRRYPLAALLNMLILAALHGAPSWRGMWLHPEGTRASIGTQCGGRWASAVPIFRR